MDASIDEGLQVNLESGSGIVTINEPTNMPNALDEENENEVVSVDPSNPKRNRRLTSIVWSYFEKFPMVADGILKAKCMECGVLYKVNSKTGTGSVLRHMETCQHIDTRDVGQLLLWQDKQSLALSAKRFDPEHFCELIITVIILHDLLFSFVKYEAIRATYQYLHPKINLVSINTLKTDVLRMFSRDQIRIQSMLELTLGRICLTSDMWTSMVTYGYLTLTAHFIDKDWVLQKRILNFCFMPPPYTGLVLSKKLYALLCE